MANKKRNEILEEQRRSREEFLKLKKMQKGEMDAGPKPSEIAIVPKTPKEKLANYWFQYKWHTIGIVSSLIVFIFLVAQCMSVPDYDLSVVYFTYTPVIDNHTDLVEDYFEEYGEDINDDGEINIQVINCSVSNERGDVQYRNTQLQKLQALLAGEEKAMLFITDDESIEFFDNTNFEGGIFEEEPLPLSEEFYLKTTSEDFGRLPDGLKLSCRKVSKTTLEEKETAKNCYKEAMRILELLEKEVK